MEDIPLDLVINLDQTAIYYVPRSHWTVAIAVSQRVEVLGLADKRQITALFGGTITCRGLSGNATHPSRKGKSL